MCFSCYCTARDQVRELPDQARDLPDRIRELPERGWGVTGLRPASVSAEWGVKPYLKTDSDSLSFGFASDELGPSENAQ